MQAFLAAAPDHDPPQLVVVVASQLREAGHLVRGREHEDLVAREEPALAGRDQGLVAAHDPDRDVVLPTLQPLVERGQRDAIDVRAFPNPHPHQLQRTVRELRQVRRRLAGQELERLPGALPLRVDHEVDAEVLAGKDAARLVVLGVADAGQLDLDAVAGRGQAAEHVDFVLAGHGEQQARAPDAGFLEDGEGGAVAGDGEDVELSRDLLRALGIGLDDDDVLPFLGQPLRQVEAHFTGADDHDPHGPGKFRPGARTGKMPGATPLAGNPGGSTLEAFRKCDLRCETGGS